MTMQGGEKQVFVHARQVPDQIEGSDVGMDVDQGAHITQIEVEIQQKDAAAGQQLDLVGQVDTQSGDPLATLEAEERVDETIAAFGGLAAQGVLQRREETVATVRAGNDDIQDTQPQALEDQVGILAIGHDEDAETGTGPAQLTDQGHAVVDLVTRDMHETDFGIVMLKGLEHLLDRRDGGFDAADRLNRPFDILSQGFIPGIHQAADAAIGLRRRYGGVTWQIRCLRSSRVPSLPGRLWFQSLWQVADRHPASPRSGS
ncbi:hypothetical protein DESC_940053 [Desulfosarcina cetonica]|nr:hypothetical protein DESC_940053 [Desulfosarcina cetonica]